MANAFFQFLAKGRLSAADPISPFVERIEAPSMDVLSASCTQISVSRKTIGSQKTKSTQAENEETCSHLVCKLHAGYACMHVYSGACSVWSVCMHVCLKHVCRCMYACVCVHACMHACDAVNVWMYVRVQACRNGCMYVCMYACKHADMHVCVRACMWTGESGVGRFSIKAIMREAESKGSACFDGFHHRHHHHQDFIACKKP
jgi:hypothetical protein